VVKGGFDLPELQETLTKELVDMGNNSEEEINHLTQMMYSKTLNRYRQMCRPQGRHSQQRKQVTKN
jgi:hypothetical protein